MLPTWEIWHRLLNFFNLPLGIDDPWAPSLTSDKVTGGYTPTPAQARWLER